MGYVYAHYHNLITYFKTEKLHSAIFVTHILNSITFGQNMQICHVLDLITRTQPYFGQHLRTHICLDRENVPKIAKITNNCTVVLTKKDVTIPHM
jgi:hypothetical protein